MLGEGERERLAGDVTGEGERLMTGEGERLTGERVRLAGERVRLEGERVRLAGERSRRTGTGERVRRFTSGEMRRGGLSDLRGERVLLRLHSTIAHSSAHQHHTRPPNDF